MEDILQLISCNRYTDARTLLVEKNEVDVALFLEELPREKSLMIFRILPKDYAADVFSYLSTEQKKYIVGNITDKEIQMILDELLVDDKVDFLEEMPANFVKKVLANTDDSTRKLLNRFLNYPDYSAGTIMTIEFVDLKKEMNIRQALLRVKSIGLDKETVDTCYVTDSNRRLEGVLPLRRLVLSDPAELVEDIMDTDIIFAHTLEDREEVASRFVKYDLTSMPVVDRENRLVGIITIDDILDIIEEETTEDFHRMAGIEPTEEEYLKTSFITLAKHRFTWLLVLMVSATFTGNIIKRFQDALESVVLLAAFIPMLMDTGGNAGSQSSTLVIRGIAVGDINSEDTVNVFEKELLVGISVGVALSFVNYLRLFFLERVDNMLAVTVSISLFVTVVLSKVVGGVLPILAKRLKMDPAIMAGPLITTIVDAVALIVYFSTAKKLLNI